MIIACKPSTKIEENYFFRLSDFLFANYQV